MAGHYEVTFDEEPNHKYRVTPFLRFIERSGEKVLQQRMQRTDQRTRESEWMWKDVDLQDEGKVSSGL